MISALRKERRNPLPCFVENLVGELDFNIRDILMEGPTTSRYCSHAELFFGNPMRPISELLLNSSCQSFVYTHFPVLHSEVVATKLCFPPSCSAVAAQASYAHVRRVSSTIGRSLFPNRWCMSYGCLHTMQAARQVLRPFVGCTKHCTRPSFPATSALPTPRNESACIVLCHSQPSTSVATL